MGATPTARRACSPGAPRCALPPSLPAVHAIPAVHAVPTMHAVPMHAAHRDAAPRVPGSSLSFCLSTHTDGSPKWSTAVTMCPHLRGPVGTARTVFAPSAER